MFDIFKSLGVNRPFRTQNEARDILGARIICEGQDFICDSFNDLGALYWRAPNGKLYCGSNLDSLPRY